MYAVGRVFLKGGQRVVREQSEERQRLTDAQHKALDDAPVVVRDMWTAMREEGADKLWEVHQKFRAQNGLGGTNRGTALCRTLKAVTETEVVKLEMRA
jgi:ornithine carbamoyltransferase